MLRNPTIRLATLTLLAAISWAGTADAGDTDSVLLKDGEVVRGTVLRYEAKGGVILQLANGDRIRIKLAAIDQVVHDDAP